MYFLGKAMSKHGQQRPCLKWWCNILYSNGYGYLQLHRKRLFRKFEVKNTIKIIIKQGLSTTYVTIWVSSSPKSREEFMFFSSRLRVCTGPTTMKKTAASFWVQHPLESKFVPTVARDGKLWQQGYTQS
jgi:hypothetical protein